MTYKESAEIARELAASRPSYDREGPEIDEAQVRELFEARHFRARRGADSSAWGKDLPAPKGVKK